MFLSFFLFLLLLSLNVCISVGLSCHSLYVCMYLSWSCFSFLFVSECVYKCRAKLSLIVRMYVPLLIRVSFFYLSLNVCINVGLNCHSLYLYIFTASLDQCLSDAFSLSVSASGSTITHCTCRCTCLQPCFSVSVFLNVSVFGYIIARCFSFLLLYIWRGVGWGVEGSRLEAWRKSQVRGCYNITFICTPTNQETV